LQLAARRVPVSKERLARANECATGLVVEDVSMAERVVPAESELTVEGSLVEGRVLLAEGSLVGGRVVLATWGLVAGGVRAAARAVLFERCLVGSELAGKGSLEGGVLLVEGSLDGERVLLVE
jgi:hypothetical protein